MKSRLLMAGVLVLALVAPAMAGPDNGVEFPYKSPPLEEGEIWGQWVSYHIDEPIFGYAGILFQVTYDTHELSQLRLIPGTGHVGFEQGTSGIVPVLSLPGSQSTTQTAGPIAMWATGASESGWNLEPSSAVSMSFSFTAKNTTPLNNSDTDIIISAWLIRHVLFPPEPIVLEASDWVYVSASGTAGGINPPGAAPGQGRWSHVTSSHFAVLDPSILIATKVFASSFKYGIEHVPEPAAMSLIVVGAGSMIAARWRRRKGS